MRKLRAFKCECGKKHLTVGVGPNTTCTCGLSLWYQLLILLDRRNNKAYSETQCNLNQT